MVYDNLLKWTFTSFEAGTGHFEKIFEHILQVSEEKKEELEVVTNFFQEFGKIESEYKDQLVEVCVKYQRKVYDAFSDEKMQQFFQMLFNNLLQRSDKITRSQSYFRDLGQKMEAMNQNFQKSVKGKIEMLRVDKKRFKAALTENKLNYQEYLKISDSLNENCHKKVDSLKGEEEDLQDLHSLVKESVSLSEKFKAVNKIASFRMDVGKRTALTIKEMFKEQRNKSELSRGEKDQFEDQFSKLQMLLQVNVKAKSGKIKAQEKVLISGTEKKILAYSQEAKNSHTALSNSMVDYLQRMDRSLTACGEYELDWKEKIKAQLIQFMCGYFPEKQDEMLVKAKNTEDNMEAFSSKFLRISKVLT